MFIAGPMVCVESFSTGKTLDGLVYENDYCWVFEVSNGKIDAMREYMDSHYTAKLFGMELMRFDGRPILISGAGRGLGEGIARHLAAEGAIVGVADINGQTAHDVTKAIARRRRQGLRLRSRSRPAPGVLRRRGGLRPGRRAAARGDQQRQRAGLRADRAGHRGNARPDALGRPQERVLGRPGVPRPPRRERDRQHPQLLLARRLSRAAEHRRLHHDQGGHRRADQGPRRRARPARHPRQCHRAGQRADARRPKAS